MRILQIKAEGLPLFKETLEIKFYAEQRVNEEDKDVLFQLAKDSSFYMHMANAFIGINASGKTSVLKVIQIAFAIVNNEPLNHVEARTILGISKKSVFQITFVDNDENILCLETEIKANKQRGGEFIYTITNETLWEKPLKAARTKKHLIDFGDMEPISKRNQNEVYLSDDVSFIIAHNKKTKDSLNVMSLLSYTNVNVLPFSEEIPAEVITFLDPTIEKLYFEQSENKTFIHLKFYDEDEIILNNARDLERYLSSGTIKGITTFSMVRDVLQSGGYLIMDEIENHFNKEIVSTLVRFFIDSKLNKNGGTLIFSTHYPEILDEYDRNDGIYLVRNRGGITIENLSKALKRNDIKKSDAYQSGMLEGTTPAYEAYMRLKKYLAASVE